MKTYLTSLLLCAAFLAGCAGERAGKTDINAAGTVALLFSKPEKPFTDLGTVSTLKIQPGRSDTWQSVLQKQAAMQGADAVLIDTSTLNNANMAMVSGSAIKFQPAAATPSQ